MLYLSFEDDCQHRLLTLSYKLLTAKPANGKSIGIPKNLVYIKVRGTYISCVRILMSCPHIILVFSVVLVAFLFISICH